MEQANLSDEQQGRMLNSPMPSTFDTWHLISLHRDTNRWHTLSKLNQISKTPNSLDKFLGISCSCSLREILASEELDTTTIDIRNCSIEQQLRFITMLASERCYSICLSDCASTIHIKCCSATFSISRREINNATLTSEFADIPNEEGMPIEDVLRFACLVADMDLIKKHLVNNKPDSIFNLNFQLKQDILFYGISNEKIVNLLVKNGADVMARDAKGRTPLFYAMITSIESARCLLEHQGARVSVKDNCSVSLLTYFVENVISRASTSADKVEGINLLTQQGITFGEVFKGMINFVLCKFIQMLGYRRTSSPVLNTQALCETLEEIWICSEEETRRKKNSVVEQLRSVDTGSIVSTEALDETLALLGELGAKPTSPDSDGNTALHHATCLPFYAEPGYTAMSVIAKLVQLGQAKFNVVNHKKETPLLFCLSSTQDIAAFASSTGRSNCVQEICKEVLKKSDLKATTHKEESVFHFVLMHCQKSLLLGEEDQKACALTKMLEVMELFSKAKQANVAVNKRDVHLHSPLHLWASLALKPNSDYDKDVTENYTFHLLLARLLKLLLDSGVKLNDINEHDETPLHLCRTWCAVELLLEAGAKSNVVDSSGRTPLLVAAKNRGTSLKTSCLYPDVSIDPKTFWQRVLSLDLDPWTADKHGESLLGVLVQNDAPELSKALVEVACEQSQLSDAIGRPLLDTICKDESSEQMWKVELVELLLKSKRCLALGKPGEDSPLHSSCRNIVSSEGNSVISVHWKIVELLLLSGAKSDISDGTGQSCLKISQTNPDLNNLLSKPISIEEMPVLIENWSAISSRHKDNLSKVARGLDCEQIETVHFYHKPLDEDNGSFGLVFSGIDGKDGREVAVKRIAKSSWTGNLVVPLKNCSQAVQYLFPEEDENFHYQVFELMDGNLGDYLDSPHNSAENNIAFCKDLVRGLNFLHCQDLFHGNINWKTLLYQTNPVLLKIANCANRRNSMEDWVASEIRMSDNTAAVSESSDMFSCGLAIHYLLSGKKHPFTPGDCSGKCHEIIFEETKLNILDNNIVKLDDALTPEAKHIVGKMLGESTDRPTAKDVLAHPVFWSINTKKYLLYAVSYQSEVNTTKRRKPLTVLEAVLENCFPTVVTRARTWNDPLAYQDMATTFPEMSRRPYDATSICDLVRFIRNVYEHLETKPMNIQTLWNRDFVFSEFPHLFIEVYKAVTTSEFHNLHETRTKIKAVLSSVN